MSSSQNWGTRVADRRPLPGETLGEYVDRVIVGHVQERRRAGARLDPWAFEPSFVFAPYVPVACLPTVWPESPS